MLSENLKKPTQTMIGRLRRFVTDHKFPPRMQEELDQLLGMENSDELAILENCVEQAIEGWLPQIRLLQAKILAYELARKSHHESDLARAINGLTKGLATEDLDTLIEVLRYLETMSSQKDLFASETALIHSRNKIC